MASVGKLVLFQVPRLWLQFLIFALAVALELSLVLNELVAVLIGWRGFHLGRRNATWMVCHFLATGRGSCVNTASIL